MKEYLAPEIEMISYNTEECLSNSSEVRKNGKYNIEFDLPNWEEEIV